jgi:hypothetical protein
VNRDSIAPLTGVAFLVFAILSFVISGEPPSAKDDTPEAIVNHYQDNKDAIMASSISAGIAMTALIFFAGYLRKVLSAATGAASILPGIVLAGASIMAVGFAIDTTILFAAADAADDVDPVAIVALQTLWDNDFVPIALGIVVFLLSSGLAIVQTGALPRWLGWVAIVLAIVGLTPVGFVAFMVGALWILVVSIMLAMRTRPAAPAAGPSTGM